MEEQNNNSQSPYISELDELLKQAQQSIQDFHSKCCRRLNTAEREFRQLSSDYNTLEQQIQAAKGRLGAKELLKSISGQFASLYNAVVALPDGEDKKHLIGCINGLNAYFSNCGVTVKYHLQGSSISKTDKSVFVAGSRGTGDKNLDGLVCECVKAGFDIPGESPIEEQVIVYSYDKTLNKLSASSRLDMTSPIANASTRMQKEYPFNEYIDFVCLEATEKCPHRRILLFSNPMLNYFSHIAKCTIHDTQYSDLIASTIYVGREGHDINGYTQRVDGIMFDYYIAKITSSNELVFELYDYPNRLLKNIILSKIDKK